MTSIINNESVAEEEINTLRECGVRPERIVLAYMKVDNKGYECEVGLEMIRYPFISHKKTWC